MARPAESYRGARRNYARILHGIAAWRNAGQHMAWKHQTKREFPVLDQHGIPKYTKDDPPKPITEIRPFVAIQIIHKSYAETMKGKPA